jgi:hypothetical protein
VVREGAGGSFLELEPDVRKMLPNGGDISAAKDDRHC